MSERDRRMFFHRFAGPNGDPPPQRRQYVLGAVLLLVTLGVVPVIIMKASLSPVRAYNVGLVTMLVAVLVEHAAADRSGS